MKSMKSMELEEFAQSKESKSFVKSAFVSAVLYIVTYLAAGITMVTVPHGELLWWATAVFVPLGGGWVAKKAEATLWQCATGFALAGMLHLPIIYRDSIPFPAIFG